MRPNKQKIKSYDISDRDSEKFGKNPTAFRSIRQLTRLLYGMQILISVVGSNRLVSNSTRTKELSFWGMICLINFGNSSTETRFHLLALAQCGKDF